MIVCDNVSWRGVMGIQIPRGRFESTGRLVHAHRAAMCVCGLLKDLVTGWLKGLGIE